VARELPMPGVLRRLISQELRGNQEFQSGLVRVALWLFMVGFIGAAGLEGYYRVNWLHYTLLFGAHLLWYLAILVSVVRHPEPSALRRHLGMVGDLSGTTFAIYLGGEPLTPFYLFYIWIFVSQGARYGKQALKAASIGSVVAYSLVVTLLDGWERHGLETLFLLLVLLVLPFYEYTLLRRLHEARRDAEAANRARGDFLATMTHELRTPLSGVIGMTRLLGSTRLDSEQREYVESLDASANMLQALIGDILDLSKIDARKLELRPEPFAIRHSVTEVARALTNQALDKGVELVVDVAVDVPVQVHGDPLRFRQILFNLVGNAVKFTDQGHVLIQVQLGEPRPELRRRHLFLAVRDTGIGIPRDKLGHIFNSFWQADISTTRRYGGTGLGTAIARDLTRLMKGDIGVESVEGGGSTFWVCLPFLDERRLDANPPRPDPVLQGRAVLLLESCPQWLTIMSQACRDAGMRPIALDQADRLSRALAEHDAPLDLVVLSDNARGLDLEGLSTLVGALHGGALPTVFVQYARRRVTALTDGSATLVKPFTMPELWQAMVQVLQDSGPVESFDEPSSLLDNVPAGQGSRVLVAEDDGINARLITSLLDKAGHEVVLARDGQLALELACGQSFDLALVDLRMPRMDGMDFTRAYRAHEVARTPGRHLPIVALTANAEEDARSDCLAAGMDDFLTKPVEPQLLERLLRRYRGAAG